MNKSFKPQTNLLLANVLLALASMGTGQYAYADLVDNGDGTFTCTGDCNNVDTSIKANITIDTSGGAATLNNTTINALANPNSSDPLAPEYGALIRNVAPAVETFSLINITGGNAAVINNRGTLDVVTADTNTFIPIRSFDPAGWTYDEVTRQLFNNGVEVGYAAAIRAIGNTPSLTVNNFTGENPFREPNFSQPVSGQIYGAGLYNFGDLSAGIYTNALLLTVNGNFETVRNGIGVLPSFISKISSFAGGSFTPPTLQDGTQFATNVSAGTTVFNANVGDLYVVDRNPLLTEAEALSGLSLANGQGDVGPRNSIITGTFTNAFLGSGEHIINTPNVRNAATGTINVDQSAVAVSDVVGGVSTPLYFVNGERKFTLNTRDRILNPITINDVVGAVNTINATAFDASITALNGTGNNTLNLNCLVIGNCSNTGSLSGFTTMNVTGQTSTLEGNYSVSGDINLLNGESGFLLNNNGTIQTGESILGGSLIANRVIIGPNAHWKDNAGTIGSITGNLINQGSLDVGTATLPVDGNATMEAGSRLLLTVGNAQQGNINVTGTNTVAFNPQSTVLTSIQSTARINEGFSFVAANNVNGIPLVQAPGFLQWIPSLSGDDLLLTADIRIPSFLIGQVSAAASNALEAVFDYTGNAAIPSELQTELLQEKGDNLIGTAERLRPEINDGALRMVQGNTDKVFGILESRLLQNYLPNQPETAKVAASGDVSGIGNNSLAPSKGVWVQGFGDRGSQARLDGVDGYNSSAAGFAVGADKNIDEAGNQRFGFALGYARGNVSNTGYTANNRVDIDSYLVAGYGSWALDGWYLNGMLGFGRNTYESKRTLLQYTATGNHDSWQFSSRVDAGMPIMFSDNLTFVPMATLDYNRIKESGYKENGKDSKIARDANGAQIIENGLPVFTTTDSPLNLEVDGRSFDSVRGGIGGKAIYSLQEKDWGAELELHALYRHEFGDLAQDSRARFTFGGTQFISPGLNPDRNSLLLGGSVRLTGDDEDDQLTLLTSYDAELRDKYLDQTMTLNLRYDIDQAPRYIKGAKAKLAKEASKNAAKQAKEQKVSATQQEIVAINQAMQSELEFKQEVVLDDNQQAIDKTIKSWTTALSNKNLDVYFNSYAADFVTPDGSSRQQWERNRKHEIDQTENPAIKVSYLSIKPEGNRALAMFTQTVATDEKQVKVRKLVDLENRNGRWLIVREDSMVVEP